MSRPIIFDVSDWLNGICQSMNLPSVNLDFHDTENKSLAVIQTSSPVIEKEYINGSKIFRLEFEVVIQGNVEDKLKLKDDLTQICMFLTDCKDVAIPTDRKILKVSSTAPSIRNLTEGQICQFGISVSLTYKEM